ncbi:cyclic nucleotide-binding domain-containing protein [Desulfobacterales bacterium HSG17]|nr:cyclic nucleotide-binding domain-containing protein [Desulfobacterales bacterium HSG17]
MNIPEKNLPETNIPETNIIVIEEQEKCPLYNIGDEFCMSGTALVLPQEKPVCLVLVKDITDFLENNSHETIIEELTCSGCTGKIRLEYQKYPEKTCQASKNVKELSNISNLLSKFSIFKSLNKDNVKEIISFLKLKKFNDGDIIIKKGEPGKNLYIIASGKVKVLGDESVNIAYLSTGEVFGEMSLLCGEPVGATIKIVEPSKILFISGQDFRKILIKFPSLQIYFTKLLARRLAKTNIARAEEFSSGMIGKLSEMPPPELFQTLNTNQKTGILLLDLVRGAATVTFRDGQLVSAVYKDLKEKDAFFAILKEKDGRFKFSPGLPDKDLKADIMGDFMWLLMEGVRMIDEQN